MPVARLAAATKRRGATLALDAISLDFAPGEIVALLGPNGAGKSTAVALLTGQLAPDSGTVTLFGQDPRHAESRTRLGVMLQQAGMPRGLTVAEQVALFSRYYPAPIPLHQAIARAGLGGLEHRRCSALSGGQQRRLQFALAICGNPDFLVLDEPSTAMDAEARRSLWAAIRSEAARGAAVLLTTHQLDEAEALADRVVVIDHGRVIADGATQAIKAGAAASALRCRTTLADEALAGLPGVATVKREGGRAVLLTTQPQATLRALLAADEAVDDIALSGATLEDAFSRLIDAHDNRKVAA
jgi:ABC-2 type transport system ATP-binding protein